MKSALNWPVLLVDGRRAENAAGVAAPFINHLHSLGEVFMARTGRQMHLEGVKARTKVGAKADRNGKGVKGAEGEEATKGTGAAKGSASSSKAGLIGVSSGRTVKSNRAENVSMPEATDRVADGGTAGPVNSKQKLVRDSFTMPRPDFALIDMLKERMVAYRRPTKKSDLLRAGLHTLMALPDVKVREVLDGLAPLKAGRPRKNS